MNRCILFCIGAVAAVVSEVFWKGRSRWSIALWGGIGMLLLRRIVLRFPFESRALLSILGALLLAALRLALLILQGLHIGSDGSDRSYVMIDFPSFSYGLYRFLLIAPAYTIIEYLEGRFRI